MKTRGLITILIGGLFSKQIVFSQDIDCGKDDSLVVMESIVNVDTSHCDKNVIVTSKDKNIDIYGDINIGTHHSFYIQPKGNYVIKLVAVETKLSPKGVIQPGDRTRIGSDNDDKPNENLRSTANLIIYPNPVEERLTIETNLVINSYKIINTFGIIHKEGSLTNKNIEVKELLKGIYNLIMYTQTGEVLTKIISKK
ncbi:hypothetical protein T190115A13A_180064 [Tenacibaculum sp. 190524A02b]|uniref:Secretion system C-terminal sorting domain-containing protein n=1 Tax=Tenacibaculum vairaonense TaxID=3137860 RepID=A0ABM9PJD0_9FLAO